MVNNAGHVQAGGNKISIMRLAIFTGDANATITPEQFNLFNLFYVRLLNYSILLKARHDELKHDTINLHNIELIQR